MTDTVIYGGTFNPVHNAHYELMRILANDSFTDRLLVIPTFVPPHKDFECTVDNIHRLNMCKIATKGISNAFVSDIEMKRGGKSYTVDTICELKSQYPDKTFSVACGGDMLITLDTWKNYPELIKTAGITAVFRKGTDRNEFDRYVKKIIADGGRVNVIDCDLPDIASKRLRRMIKSGDDIKELVPCEIYEYIVKNNLYK